MKVAVYARVSTSDKDQDPETQLMPLRDFCIAQGLEVFDEYVDYASASDLAHRTGWRRLLDDAAKRRFKMVLVFKLDRGFRSVKHMHDTLSAWELVGVSFNSLTEQFDTSTAMGRLILNLLTALAEFELELIRERVKAGNGQGTPSALPFSAQYGRAERSLPMARARRWWRWPGQGRCSGPA